MSYSGDSDPVKTQGDAGDSSTPVRTGAHAFVTSGDLNTKKSAASASASSAPLKPTGRTGSSSGLSIGGRGKAVALDSGDGDGGVDSYHGDSPFFYVSIK